MKVLISAYACNPTEGSEPAVGWMWSIAAAQNHEVCVLTRANNRPAIEAELAKQPRPTLSFAYVELPSWTLRLKRGALGLRLYYIAWQVSAARKACVLQQQRRFDVVHHLTFANMWLPSFMGRVGPPLVLGPLGGGQRVPLCLYPILGMSGMAKEISQLLLRNLLRVTPWVRRTWMSAACILVNNAETQRALPSKSRSRIIIRPNACVLNVAPDDHEAAGSHTAIYAGRLNRFKGVELALRAIAQASGWNLIVVGDGPDAARLKRLTRTLEIDSRVRFLGWLPRHALWQEMRRANVLLFPSLKEGAPLIVAEAQAMALPVVAFDRGGVAVVARMPKASVRVVRPARRVIASCRLARALADFAHNQPGGRAPDVGLTVVERDIDAVYRSVVQASPSGDYSCAPTLDDSQSDHEKVKARGKHT